MSRRWSVALFAATMRCCSTTRLKWFRPVRIWANYGLHDTVEMSRPSRVRRADADLRLEGVPGIVAIRTVETFSHTTVLDLTAEAQSGKRRRQSRGALDGVDG